MNRSCLTKAERSKIPQQGRNDRQHCGIYFRGAVERGNSIHMKLDVLIATYNRSELLGRALQSLLAGSIPPGAEVCVTVVDNN